MIFWGFWWFFHIKYGSSRLKSVCGCVNTNIYKKWFSKTFNYFLKKQSFKKSHQGGGRSLVDPNPHFLGLGHGKTKPNRWVERSPKMRNLHRCHCKEKFSKYEKKQNHTEPDAWGLQLYLKKDSDTGIFLWILRNFWEQLFYRTPLNKETSTQSRAIFPFYTPWN